MQGRSSPERLEFISVPVCHRSSRPIGDCKGFALFKFDRKTIPFYSSSALYVSITGYYFGIILLDFLLYKELNFLLFQRSVV